MQSIDVAILGAGQAGLAVSRCLAVFGIDHVLFERGSVAERWKSTTWDSLRLLTPNWMNGLPWQPYEGIETHGFMTRDEVVAFLERYTARFRAPVLSSTNVVSVQTAGDRFQIETEAGVCLASAVIIATGHCDIPSIPQMARKLSPSILSLHSSRYRSPDALPQDGVLVIGASSSGVQIADELRRSGREVILSVGKHTRLPRSRHGHDIFWWLTRLGKLAEHTDRIAAIEAARHQPSLQLVGRSDRANSDLPSLQEAGVQLVGRLESVEQEHLRFSSDLQQSVRAADEKMERILNEIDGFASGSVHDVHRLFPTVDIASCVPTSRLSLISRGIRTIIWATGFKRDFAWLKVPVIADDGEIEHQGGVTAVPGLYALGFQLLRKRDSNFLGGVGTDASVIATHIARFLGQTHRKAA